MMICCVVVSRDKNETKWSRFEVNLLKIFSRLSKSLLNYLHPHKSWSHNRSQESISSNKKLLCAYLCTLTSSLCVILQTEEKVKSGRWVCGERRSDWGRVERWTNKDDGNENGWKRNTGKGCCSLPPLVSAVASQMSDVHQQQLDSDARTSRWAWILLQVLLFHHRGKTQQTHEAVHLSVCLFICLSIYQYVLTLSGGSKILLSPDILYSIFFKLILCDSLTHFVPIFHQFSDRKSVV